MTTLSFKANRLSVVFLAVAALTLSACQLNNAGQKQVFGSLGGAALGGLAGAQVGSGTGQLAAVAVGALLGGFLGSEVGASLDRADKLAMQQTRSRTLETARTGQTVPWQNPDSGNSGAVTVERTYDRGTGQFCREYRQTVEIDGQTEILRGTACRQSDGTWADI
ncbi:MAG: RT0821/Lpp0805 family surface protein [Pseudomonadota bacterium]